MSGALAPFPDISPCGSGCGSWLVSCGKCKAKQSPFNPETGQDGKTKISVKVQ